MIIVKFTRTLLKEMKGRTIFILKILFKKIPDFFTALIFTGKTLIVFLIEPTRK